MSRIPPLVLVFLTAMMMWATSVLAPSLALSFSRSFALAAAFACAGLFISLAAVSSFRKARTTVNPLTPGETSELVQSGVYRLSRNPMYLGFLLMLAGWAVWLENGLSAIFLPGYFLYIDRLQIPREERALLYAFGEDFRQYKQSVRRWI